jgi:hypothetical protein
MTAFQPAFWNENFACPSKPPFYRLLSPRLPHWQLLAGLATLPAERYGHTPLLTRIWELRHNLTAYDAADIALAEATDSVLYTTDEKLSKGHRAQVRLFPE